MKIAESVRIYSEIRDRLLAVDPELDETTLADTLEGETDVRERILWIARKAKENEASAKALGGMIDDMRARKTRFEDTSERLRSLALWAMQETGLTNIIAPDLTLSIGKGRVSVQIIDPMEVPPHLVTYTPTPDKAAIKAELEAGKEVPGATLSNSPPSLTIRTK